MSGKRILDIVAVFNASRDVAQKHLALRSKQLGLYGKTSSLAKIICSRAEWVAQSVEKSSILPSYLDDSLSTRSSRKSLKHTTISDREPESIPGADSTNPSSSHAYGNTSNTYQDNFQQRSSIGSPSNEPPPKTLKGQQKDIEPLNTHATNINFESNTISSANDPGPEKKCVEKFRFQLTSTQASLGDQDIPEDVDIDLFQSPRVAKLLGGKIQRSPRSAVALKAISISKDLTYSTSNKDQEHLTIRESSHTQHASPDNSSLGSSKALSKELSSSGTHSEILKHEIDVNETPYELRESKVPSSRLARLWNYGGLAAGMFGGMVGEGFRRASGSRSNGSFVLNARNMDRLVTRLSRMRGAALKLGQMISFQDSKTFPALEVLQRVQDRADYMPSSQRDKVLAKNLGSEWRHLFSSFDEIPMAAASIGQVHRAVLASNGVEVAVKVQYPGVADSIDSDLKNLEMLLVASKMLPKGLYLDKTISNARTELAWECDYEREAEYGRRFRQSLSDEADVFAVPNMFPEASGKQVLTMEFMNGLGITKVKGLSQEQKDWIGTQILRLCLREITEFKFMQTDPNWTNFLIDNDTQKLALLDFGASREYSQDFISKYTQLLAAASKSNKDLVIRLSIALGYLTGYESKDMLNAHVTSILTLAEPFHGSSPHIYDFRDQTITSRVTDLIPLMMRERLAPPPEETYSLHRKLSGSFLLCARLGSRVPCRKLFDDSFKKAGII